MTTIKIHIFKAGRISHLVWAAVSYCYEMLSTDSHIKSRASRIHHMLGFTVSMFYRSHYFRKSFLFQPQFFLTSGSPFCKGFFYKTMELLTARNTVSKSLQKDWQTFLFWTKWTFFFNFLEQEKQMSNQTCSSLLNVVTCPYPFKAHTTEPHCILRLFTVTQWYYCCYSIFCSHNRYESLRACI